MNVLRWLLEFNTLFHVKTTIMYSVLNYVSNPFDPSTWNGASDTDADFSTINTPNPCGVRDVGRAVITNAGNSVYAPFTSNFISPSPSGVYHAAMVIKIISGVSTGLYLRVRNAGGTLNQIRINLDNDVSSEPLNVKVTELDDGFKLVQFRYDYDGLSGDIKVEMYYRTITEDASSDFNATPGDTFDMQAAFFGKIDEWPALVQPVQVC